VPPGWTSDASGYFFTEFQLVEFATAAFTYEEEAVRWEAAYWELNSKFKAALADFDRRLIDVSERHESAVSALEKEHESVVSTLEKEIVKTRRRERLPGIGFFAGPAYNGERFELAAGIGLAWKF
jgi:hypothetical protein